MTKKFYPSLKKIKPTLKKWSVNSFLQQLTVVVLGIFITFSGNNYFQERSTQQKLKSTLILVKKELERNKEMLQEIRSRFNSEYDFAFTLNKNKKDIKKIDSSYLVKNQSIFFHLDSRVIESDALEVLKMSSLIQDFKNQNLCFELLSTYSSIEQALRVYEFYMELKRMRNQKLFDFEPFIGKYNALISNPYSIYDVYTLFMSENLFISLFETSLQSISDESFNHAIGEIDCIIAKLNQEYSLDRP